MKFFFSVIGMVMFIEGLPYFGFPKKMKQMLKMMIDLDDAQLRRFGFILMLSGLGVVYAAMKGF